MKRRPIFHPFVPLPRVTLNDFWWATGSTCIGEELSRREYHTPWKRKGTRRIGLRVLAYPALGAHVFTPGHFRVAPKEWPESVKDVWPEALQPMPSPAEVVGIISQAARGKPQGIGRMEWSAFWWWMLGIPAWVIERKVPNWEDAARVFLQTRLSESGFFLWALSPDFRVLARSPTEAKVALWVHGMNTVPYANSGRRRDILQEWVKSEYVKALCAPGSRHKPLPRGQRALEGRLSFPSYALFKQQQKKSTMEAGNQNWYQITSMAGMMYPLSKGGPKRMTPTVRALIAGLKPYLSPTGPTGPFLGLREEELFLPPIYDK